MRWASRPMKRPRWPPDVVRQAVRLRLRAVEYIDGTGARQTATASAEAIEVGDVSIVSEDRHEFGEHSEAEVHQVRIEVPRAQLPSSEDELYELQGRLIESAERWARSCFEDRHADLTES